MPRQVPTFARNTAGKAKAGAGQGRITIKSRRTVVGLTTKRCDCAVEFRRARDVDRSVQLLRPASTKHCMACINGKVVDKRIRS